MMIKIHWTVDRTGGRNMGCEGIDRGREYEKARTTFITRVPQVSGRMLLFNTSLFGGPFANRCLARDFLIMVYVFVVFISL